MVSWQVLPLVRRECFTTTFRLSPWNRSDYASNANSLHTLNLCAPVNWRATEGDKEVISCTAGAPGANGVHESALQTDDPVVVAPPLLVMHSAHLLLHWIGCLPQPWTLDVDIALLTNPPFAEALQSPVPSLVHLEQVLRLSDWFYGCTPTSQSIASQHQLVEHLG